MLFLTFPTTASLPLVLRRTMAVETVGLSPPLPTGSSVLPLRTTGPGTPSIAPNRTDVANADRTPRMMLLRITAEELSLRMPPQNPSPAQVGPLLPVGLASPLIRFRSIVIPFETEIAHEPNAPPVDVPEEMEFRSTS